MPVPGDGPMPVEMQHPFDYVSEPARSELVQEIERLGPPALEEASVGRAAAS